MRRMGRLREEWIGGERAMARILMMSIQESAMIRGLEKTRMQLQFVYSVFGFLREKKDFFIWMRWIRSMA